MLQPLSPRSLADLLQRVAVLVGRKPLGILHRLHGQIGCSKGACIACCCFDVKLMPALAHRHKSVPSALAVPAANGSWAAEQRLLWQRMRPLRHCAP